MGMFDYIRCDYVLPDGSVGIVDQTKEFSCMMATHVIDIDGQLWEDRGHAEDVPKTERPFPDAPDGSLSSFAGSMKWVPDLHKSGYSGALYVGDYVLIFRKGIVAFCDPSEGEGGEG